MKKRLFVLLLGLSLGGFAHAQEKIPKAFDGLWASAGDIEYWHKICKNPKVVRDGSEDDFVVFIDVSKKMMKLDGSWTSEMSYFQTVNLNSDKTQISGKERTTVLWRDGIYTNEEEGKATRYQLRVDGDRLYINEFLLDKPSDYAFIRCKK